MPSDRRFHPLTIVFALGGELRNFLLPAVFATITASEGNGAERFFLVFLVPGAVMAVARYFFSTYRYDATELVVRTGVIFKNERHIPFARIQSVDAVQNVLHRFCGVVDVRVQTGTTGQAEATLSVLPFEALDEMRQHVFHDRAVAAQAPIDDDGTASVPSPLESMPEGVTLLRLSLRDRALAGLLDNRGWVVIGAAWGLAFESGVLDRVEELDIASWPAYASILVGLFVMAPVLSMGWAIIRLHDFHLTLRAGDLRTEFGALTRVTATIPLGRVQALKVHRGPGHVWTGRASVRVETAGGTASGRASSEREWVAPIITLASLPAFVAAVLPNADLTTLTWMDVDARAFRRRRVVALVTSALIGVIAAPWLGALWSMGLTGAVAVLCLAHGHLYVASLGWAKTDRVVAFKSGWFHRSLLIVPLAKIQAVELDESPFDRRHHMASLSVDTAGAGGHTIDIPYLSRAVAEDARVSLAHEAAATVFRW
ncbi:MAG TPA: PH domain-containing protein [Vicinamibacterales bacterium]|nr:PH domain-containing protein [Vicinamibacterales bacterium]